MKTHLVLLPLAMLLSAAAHHGAKAAGSDALKCGYQAQYSVIDCTVVGKEADVTEIKLNAGDCYMFLPLAADVRKNYIERFQAAGPLPEQQQRWFSQLVANKLSTMRQSSEDWDQESSHAYKSLDEYLADLDPRYTVDPSQVYFLFNPINDYRQGQSFTIQTAGCSIWQFEITVNGQVAKWSKS